MYSETKRQLHFTKDSGDCNDSESTQEESQDERLFGVLDNAMAVFIRGPTSIMQRQHGGLLKIVTRDNARYGVRCCK